ncbi:hypothetical protein Afil01_22870 [Actinorhabdospora filicis]|uniref:HTH cro/C1-type domain-containing protein n=1 Tax=Actinorhabdospora filicis TaxID=1785913 RepID=A0A9W6WAC1_9ACTN|nr:BTAD domain-containing putative transcriptional regulator [Actinorhabdospora filicis]GLZ77480.1 hypothetical protein Afil01_22870 [Actinorhabdospora filicis]
MDGAPHTIGSLVRDRRLALGTSQRKLAATTGLSLGMIRDLEQGRTRRPYGSSLRRLSSALSLDLVPAEHAVAMPSSTNGAEPPVRVSILGVLEVQVNGMAVHIGIGKVRTLIARLAVSVGTVIGRAALVDLLWGDAPPPGAENRAVEYVRRAGELLSPMAGTGRRAPTAGPIERVGRGYRLRADQCVRDSDEFVALCERGRVLLDADRHHEAAELLDGALRLWRDEALPEIETLTGHPEVLKLSRLRCSAVQSLATSLSALERFDEALVHLESAAARDPFDESVQSLLLLTLARSGRQSEALVRYRSFCGLLSRELGVRPTRELADTHRRILTQRIGPASQAR